MSATLAVSWGFFRRSVATAIALVILLPAPDARAADAPVSVIVRKLSAGAQPERLVERLGGRVTRSLGIINGFAADLPRTSVERLRASENVDSVSPDHSVELMDGDEGSSAGDGASMLSTAKVVRATDLWRKGITGRGVDVALIDSGVVPVKGLTVPGKVINGPDLSFESQAPHLRYLDTFGHGTHMAGIIAGSDGLSTEGDYFAGIAPSARLVSVKVAESTGATDVSQVIAAIDWVVQHRRDNGLNIRVLNLSFGTDGTQHYVDDPLAYAAEVAWRKGIVVVAAAGNGGSRGLTDPAIDPYVIAVGANDPKGTRWTSDDEIPAWSARGNGTRDPDLVAPGRSIASLRNPGSYIDTFHAGGRAGQRFFRGSGTSQSAAVVSGAAALLLQDRPSLTPDQVKALLTSTARPIPGATRSDQGAGQVDLYAAHAAPVPSGAAQAWQRGTGFGSLEGARGSAHVAMDEVELRGEQDIFAAAWNARAWAAAALKETSWSGGTWNTNQWAGADWDDSSSWTSSTWSSSTWSGSSWSGSSWSASSWSSMSWSGSSWSSSSWGFAASSWSSSSWTASSWTTSFWG